MLKSQAILLLNWVWLNKILNRFLARTQHRKAVDLLGLTINLLVSSLGWEDLAYRQL
jgi:hypothetical protein